MEIPFLTQNLSVSSRSTIINALGNVFGQIGSLVVIFNTSLGFTHSVINTPSNLANIASATLYGNFVHHAEITNHKRFPMVLTTALTPLKKRSICPEENRV